MNRPVATSTPSETKSPGGVLSSKVLGMKFMQRAQEGVKRVSLQQAQDKALNEAQWTAPTSATNTPVRPQQQHVSNTNTPATPQPASSSAASTFHSSPFHNSSSFLPTASASFFAPELHASATPSLPASASSLISTDGSSSLPTSSASFDTPVATFIAGRRSYGNFNTQLDAIVAEAREKSNEELLGIKNDKREKKYSVDDESMADHYVGLRGKGSDRSSGGGGGNRTNDDRFPPLKKKSSSSSSNKNHNNKRSSHEGGGNSQQSHKKKQKQKH